MKFAVEHADGLARSGTLVTDHGAVQTPVFMPVGTQGTVKAIEPRELVEVGAELILGNTYHLYLRPGTDILHRAGGLHKLMGWDRAILTDSGGYQIFSLSELRKITDDGVEFRSHIDGSLHFFTPESIIDIQRVIGSDIMMVLDECTAYPCSYEDARQSNEQTLRWAERCRKQFLNSVGFYDHAQVLFGIVQGGVFPDIRKRSIDALVDLDFEGYAIGGLAVGEPAEQMYEIVSSSTELLPFAKPRYLMGVGTPENLLEGIERGIDMFDCVLPTRNGRNATLFTTKGALNITNAQFRDDFTPIDDTCGCYACRHFTRAYVRHLFQAKEILGLQLATIHNLFFYEWIMREARQAIVHNNFHGWKQEQLASFRQEARSDAQHQ